MRPPCSESGGLILPNRKFHEQAGHNFFGIRIMPADDENDAQQTLTWTCDVCHRPIENPRDGWVEWLTILEDDPSKPIVERGLRLVHRESCSPRRNGCNYTRRDEDRVGGSVS